MSDTGRAADPPDSPVTGTGAEAPRPTRIFLVRHAQSTWNQDRRIQGQADPPLSDEGRAQAARLGAWAPRRQWAGFYASDLKRAWETAGALADGTGTKPEPMPELREVALGEWEGLTGDELAERFPDLWAQWQKHPDWDLAPGGEGALAFETRVAGAIDGLVARHPGGDVLAVTHGGVIQVTIGRVLGRRSHGPFPFRISNASVTLIERVPRGLVVTAVNLTPSLP